MSLYDSVQELYENELYEEITFLEELIPEKEREELSSLEEAHLNVCFADAYYHTERYNIGSRFYRNALDWYAKNPRVTTKDFTEGDVRFRFHKCLLKQKKHDEAIAVLQKIADKEDVPPKVKFALFKLLSAREIGPNMAQNHAAHLKVVAQNCPSAIYSMSMMLRCGLKVNESDVSEDLQNDVVEAWLKSQSLLGQGQAKAATKCLSSVNVTSYRITLELGRVYARLGMKDNARAELMKAHYIDEDRTLHMDTLAALLAEEKGQYKELEQMGLHLMTKQEDSIEANIAFGYLCRGMHPTNLTKALHVAYKACCMTSSISGRAKSEAYLLKSLLLKELERVEDAVKQLQEGIRYDPLCFELNESLVNLHLQKLNWKDARSAALACVGMMPNDPRALILKAKVLMKQGTTTSKADDEFQEGQRILEPIVNEHPYLLDAVWTLLDHYERVGNYEKAIEVLKKLTNSSFPVLSMAKLHHMLGDFLARSQQPDLAYEHMNIALANGHEESNAHMSTLETAMFQTPSPTPGFRGPPAPRCPPPAPRRNYRPSRMAGSSSSRPDPSGVLQFDSSEDASSSFDTAAMDTSNDTNS